MKKKGLIFGLSALFLGAVAFLSSCNQMNREEVTPHEKETLSVTTEMYLQEADGTLTFLGDGLRAVSGATNKGTVTGDGEYNYNASVTLKVDANSGYLVHKFYEEAGKGGFTEQTSSLAKESHQVNFTIKDDMKFKVIFTEIGGGSERRYQNLKVDNKLEDYTKRINGESSFSETIPAVGEELQAVKDPSGTIISWSMLNPQFKAWEVTSPSETWLKRSIDPQTGVITIEADAFHEKSPARTATFRVGKDGNPASPENSAWRTITITQDSYWVATSNTPDRFEYKDGSGVVDLPATLEVELNPNGDSKDLKTLNPALSKPIVAVYEVWKNGEKTSEVIKKDVTMKVGDPADNWLKKQDTTVSAGANNTDKDRKTAVTIEFTVDEDGTAKKLDKETTINVSQKVRKYNVDVELQ